MTPDLKTWLRRPRRFVQYSSAEQRVFYIALWRLPTVALALRIAGLHRVERAIARRSPPTQRRDSQISPEDVARVVHAAARIGPFHATCLTQSLTLWWILRDCSTPAELRLGVRREPGRLTAHAWVEHAGRPLDEGPNLTSDFAILNKPSPIDPE